MNNNPRTMDLTVRRAAAPSDVVVPKPAAALHTRQNPAHVIDLREGGSIQMNATFTPHASAPAIAHAPNHVPAAPPKSTAHERHIARFTDRFERARNMSRSAQISRFGTDRFGNIQDPHKMYDKFGNPTLNTLVSHGAEASTTAHGAAAATHGAALEHHAPGAPGPAERQAAGPYLPPQTVTQHEAMTRLPALAPAPTPAPASVQPAWRPHLGLSPHRASTMATVAAVVIMGGYVWLQNYPKLAIQSAGDKAGLTATLPGYLPSSYNLDRTLTSPGLVTLDFTSPSSTDTLKIIQHRTTWDSGSLLDNFVAKQADDYGTVQGQGLTIYLFNNNQAAWVNHGIWYSIEGASRLSREQILKIAYSL